MSEHPRPSAHAKALWSLCWRMLLFTPVAILGLVLLAVVLAATVCPPVYAVIALVNGRCVAAPLAIFGWVLWLRFGGPVRRLVFEGFEHASL